MIMQIITSHIPKSWRASATLVLTIIFGANGLTALNELAMPHAHTSTWSVVRVVGGMMLALAFGIMFYYFQAKDRAQKEYQELETLSACYEQQRAVNQARPSGATSYNDHDDEIE